MDYTPLSWFTDAPLPNTRYVYDSYTEGDYVYVETSGRHVDLGVCIFGVLSENVELDVKAAKRLRRALKAAIKEIENR
jgi:hypothetical protein